VLDLMPNESEGLVSAALAAPCAPIFPSWCWLPVATANQKMEALRWSTGFSGSPLHPQQLEAAIQRSSFHYSESTESEIVPMKSNRLAKSCSSLPPARP